jgi:hypothetical protein
MGFWTLTSNFFCFE